MLLTSLLLPYSFLFLPRYFISIFWLWLYSFISDTFFLSYMFSLLYLLTSDSS